MINMCIPVIVIAGPTASGKTALAAHAAKRFDGEVVGADSMQVYKGLDIASAKPSREEMLGITHHMIDFLPLTESFSVAQYSAMAKGIIFDIYERGKTPVVAGGTGLYIDSLMQNIDFDAEPENGALREELRKRLEEEGPDALYKELLIIDPETAKELHPNNAGRVIRALEVCMLTGETMSGRRERSRRFPSPFCPVYIGLGFRDREKLYERINERVDRMLTAGLAEEARETARLRGPTSGQAIGHKELLPFINGELTLGEAADALKTGTRRYAKRQLTWFRRNREMNWFFRDDYKDENSLFDAVDNLLIKEGF